jgi:hypothetical protein
MEAPTMKDKKGKKEDTTGKDIANNEAVALNEKKDKR